MTTFGAQILTGLQVLAMPLNLVALVMGIVAGGVLGALFRRVGVSGAAALVLLMPLAAILDPTTGLVLLGACLTAALIATTHDAPQVTGTSATHHKFSVPLLALLTGLTILLAGATAAGMLQTASPADTLALLVCGTAAAIVLAAATHPAGWLAAVALTLTGVALQLSPFSPLDAAKASPVPLLFGLLVTGPALIALAVPARVLPWTTAFGGIELVAAVLPALLLGVPATRGISVIALNLGESGLVLGPKLMIQRPKVVLGFVLALIVAAVVGVLGRLVAHRLPRLTRWPTFADATTTRIAGGIILVAALGALMLSGALADAETHPLPTLAIASVLAAIAAWFGLELAPLVTGLVLGQLMQAPLRALGKSGGIDAALSGSKPLLVLAVVAAGAALAWPLLARRVNP